MTVARVVGIVLGIAVAAVQADFGGSKHQCRKKARRSPLRPPPGAGDIDPNPTPDRKSVV